MDIEQIYIRTRALKGDSTAPGEWLLADAAGIGSLEDPEYIRSMKNLVTVMAHIAQNVNGGSLPPEFDEKVVNQYLAARSEKVPGFDVVSRDEVLGRGNGHILSFVRQMKQAIREVVPETARRR